jgi:hypothetical protein
LFVVLVDIAATKDDKQIINAMLRYQNRKES